MTVEKSPLEDMQVPLEANVSSASYALASLQALYLRANYFTAIGRDYGFPEGASFEDFETATTEYLSALGKLIYDEQLVNATWYDAAGEVQQGGFVGLDFQFEKETGLNLELQVVPQHDMAHEPLRIAARQMIGLASAESHAPRIYFAVQHKTDKNKPAPKPGERIQAIINHFAPAVRTPFRP